MRSSKIRLSVVVGLFVLCLLAALPLGLALARPRADTTVGGPILSDTVWTAANSPYIVTSNINVLSGVTLTVQAGTIVKFNAGFKLQVNGQLIVNGTSEAPVVFTSNQATPAPGDWDKIEFATTAVTSTVGPDGEYIAGSLLRGCVVEYGGALDNSVVLVGQLMDNCTVRYSSNTGVSAINYYDSGDTYSPSEPAWIVQSTITNNEHGVALSKSTLMSSTVSANSDGGVSVYGGRVVGNVIRGNTATGLGYGGGLYAHGVDLRPVYVARNQITGNISYKAAGGAYVGGLVTFEDNIVASNLVTGTTYSDWDVYGGGLYVDGPAIVVSNTIANNIVFAAHGVQGFGGGIYASPGASIRGNAIVGNQVIGYSPASGLDCGPVSQVHNNTIYGNTPFDVGVLPGGNAVSGTLNYWGTSNQAGILSRIYDFYDNSGLGEFKFIPYLSQPDPGVPVPPPLNLALQSQPNGALKISWDANPSFATGWGYKVYYGNSSTPPFNGMGQPAGNSPIDMGSNTNIVLSAPLPKFVTVTAYDTQGHESWYASALSTAISYKVFLPLVLR